MMTNYDILTKLWMWNTPAWWIALAAIGVYLLAVRKLRVSKRQIGFFAVAIATFLIALASPLATLATRYVFSAHMAQHLIMLLIVPVCMLLAWPTSIGRGDHERSTPGRMVPLAWGAGLGAMWLWHIPALCNASMRWPTVFGIQQVSLIAAGIAFWWPVFGPILSQRIPPHLAVGYLFSACLGCSLLGIYITFSPISVCPMYATPPAHSELMLLIRQQWGLTCKLDQQIGGLLMWVPACMIYFTAIMASLKSWYTAGVAGVGSSAGFAMDQGQ
jgi:cytochrome c oxidase assembly factor CtaG